MKNIGKYNQDVNNMSIKARMTRYQALEAQVDAILRELYEVDYQADAEEMMSRAVPGDLSPHLVRCGPVPWFPCSVCPD